METVSSVLALGEGNSPVIGEFPSQRPVTWGFDVFFDIRLNKRLNTVEYTLGTLVISDAIAPITTSL